jgi:uncharacterized protein YdeI (YjbR/CyaY-like superfamily)
LQLRKLALQCGLVEELKWSHPCYTHEKKNIFLLTAFREYVALAFFKGALLKDKQGILLAPGENSHYIRQLRFTSVKNILKTEDIIKAYMFEAIEIERSGLKVPPTKYKESMPEELQNALALDPQLTTAFYNLTPGRQRGYILYFSGARYSKTRESRIEKCREKILKGEGINDNYKSN